MTLVFGTVSVKVGSKISTGVDFIMVVNFRLAHSKWEILVSL